MQPNILSGHLSWNRSRKGYKKRHKNTFEGDRYVYYLACGGGFTGARASQNLFSCHFKYTQFVVYQFYFRKAVKTKPCHLDAPSLKY